LHVSFNGKNFIEPNEVTAKNKTYPIIRPLYFYYDKKLEAKNAPLVNFILSAEGQAIVEKVGYVPLK
jgi:phosphate transport system substrate-binding protein